MTETSASATADSASLARPDYGDRLDPALRMVRKPRLVVRRARRLEMVEEEEGIEVVEPAGPEASAEMDAGALDHRLRRHDLRHAAQ